MKRQKYKIKITEAMDGQRIDLAVIADETFDLSRRKLRRILDVGGVYINKKRIRVASRKVFTGDIVDIEYNPTVLVSDFEQKFSAKDFPIIYQDDYVVAFNKPPGLATQATRDQSVMHAEKLAQDFYKQKGGAETLTLLHRLDRETSGVLLFGKTKEASAFIMEQFKEKTVQKLYLALVYGSPKEYEFRVKCSLSGIDKQTGTVKRLRSGGKKSETEFTLMSMNEEAGAALLECRPKTGRSHQIRVHLDMRGHPILGDKKYGRVLQKGFSRLVEKELSKHHMLHAQEITFKPYPKAPRVTIEAKSPFAFAKIRKLMNL